jgi:hypothetical protein
MTPTHGGPNLDDELIPLLVVANRGMSSSQIGPPNTESWPAGSSQSQAGVRPWFVRGAVGQDVGSPLQRTSGR